jgi:diguanylate cyclase (GGDEF)-like protein/PAS domain S-box-containing protein
LAVVAAVLSYQAPPGVDRRQRWCRLALGTCALTWALVTTEWLDRGGGIPVVAESIGWLLSAVIAAAALVLAPGAPRQLSGGARTLVDGLIVGASALFVAWYAGLGNAYEPGTDEALLVATAFAQVTVGGAAIVLLTRARAAARRSLALIAAGLTALAISACGVVGLAFDPSSVLAASLVLSGAAACLVAAIIGYRAVAVDPEQVDPGLPTRASVFLPSVPFAAALAVAATAGVRGEFSGFLVGCGAAIVGLIVARQILALLENITFWHRLETKIRAQNEDLRRSEGRFRSLVQNSSDVITVIGADGTIGYQSPCTATVFGYEPEEIEGPLCTDLLHPDDLRHARAAAAELLERSGSTIVVEGRIRSRAGGWRHVEAIATNLLEDPGVRGLVVNTRDITERKELEEALRYGALHDSLTSLPNRALFADRLGHALDRSVDRGESIAVLFLDLDDFKTVNDSLGHGRGDELLARVGARLLEATSEPDTVARLGGDEFAVLVENADGPGDVAIATRRLIAALEPPFDLDGQTVSVRASIGIAISPEAGTDAEDLLRAADVAMYAAKNSGNGRFAFFEPRMHAELLERMELENDLRQAVDRGQLFLEYQPIVSLEREEIHGVEALVRWRHPEHGVMAPGRFISLAEDRGFMGWIGEWALHTACTQAAEWCRAHPRTAPRRMVVNLSMTQLEQPAFVHGVEQALSESGLDPAILVLELTESVVLENDAAIAKLERLRDQGVRVSVDDFGTGYSSLSYLRRLPLDVLKIDRSFIDGLDHTPQKSAIVEAILVMSARLGIEPVAEGVERAADAAALRALGCELAQGFYFSRPVAPERIAEFIDPATPGLVDHASAGGGEVRRAPALATTTSAIAAASLGAKP